MHAFLGHFKNEPLLLLKQDQNVKPLNLQIGIHTKSEIIPDPVFPKIRNKSCFKNDNGSFLK